MAEESLYSLAVESEPKPKVKKPKREPKKQPKNEPPINSTDTGFLGTLSGALGLARTQNNAEESLYSLAVESDSVEPEPKREPKKQPKNEPPINSTGTGFESTESESLRVKIVDRTFGALGTLSGALGLARTQNNAEESLYSLAVESDWVEPEPKREPKKESPINMKRGQSPEPKTIKPLSAKNRRNSAVHTPEEFHRWIFEYLPYVGSVSYVAFSSYVMQPRLFRSVFGSWDLIASNILWYNAQLGVGLYTFSRPHLTKVSSSDRIIYSIYTTVMFNFGSTLLWALTRNKVGDSDTARVAFGVMSALGCLYMGRDYLRTLDKVSGSA